ncbi:MAG TPA: MFS transporter [Candidatus Polarisedimenticolia bacterium]|nr:MFS transporter [Candidatus Polarisedimenticolia bacterium]
MASAAVSPARSTPPSGSPSRTVVSSGARALALEGIFQALAQGLGEAYLGAFALLLGAGGLALGLVATLPTAAASLAQVMTRGARAVIGDARALVARAWSAQAIGYASLGLCALLPPPWPVPALCALALVAWGCGGIAVPAWTALVSGVVPKGRHGWFFGLRGAVQQIGVLTAIVLGGLILSWRTSKGEESLGFVIIFIMAGLARASGTLLIGSVRDPGVAAAVPRRARGRGFGPPRASAKVRRLAVYLWGLHFATYVSSPFFVPYMLRDLHLSYALVGVLVAVPAIVKMLTLRIWGRLADRLGPGPVLRTTGWLVVAVPGLWLLSKSPWWILTAQAYSGFVWGAFELAQASAILQATRGGERLVAQFNGVDGFVLIAGSLLGGAVVNLVSARGGSGYLAAMALSTLLRALPATALLWRVRGLGKPAWSHLKMPLRLWAIRPTRGISLTAEEFSLRHSSETPPRP